MRYFRALQDNEPDNDLDGLTAFAGGDVLRRVEREACDFGEPAQLAAAVGGGDLVRHVLAGEFRQPTTVENRRAQKFTLTLPFEANQKLGLAPDLRDYGVGAQILKDLDLKRIRLLTNNLTKVVGLRGFGLEITERVPIEMEPNGHNERYLKTKREKLNHVFEKF